MRHAGPDPASERPCHFLGSSREDLRAMPKPVRARFGEALQEAQDGGKPDSAKPLQGFKGAGVLEVVADFDGDTYRAVYTVRFAAVVYVLHVFQKKSPHGIETARQDLRLIEQRLRDAEEDYRERAGRAWRTGRGSADGSQGN